MGRSNRLPEAVVSVGLDAQPDGGLVHLVGGDQELSETRCAAEEQWQHAAGAGIECAGVPDARLAEHVPDARDDVV